MGVGDRLSVIAHRGCFTDIEGECGDTTLTYKSRFTTQENISIDDALEIVDAEADEE